MFARNCGGGVGMNGSGHWTNGGSDKPCSGRLLEFPELMNGLAGVVALWASPE